MRSERQQTPLSIGIAHVRFALKPKSILAVRDSYSDLSILKVVIHQLYLLSNHSDGFKTVSQPWRPVCEIKISVGFVDKSRTPIGLMEYALWKIFRLRG